MRHLHQDAAIGPHRKRGADRFLAFLRADRHGDDFRDDAFFLQTDGFFDADFVERVHRHLHVGKVDTRLVRFHPDFHVVVDDALDRDKHLHQSDLSAEIGWFRRANAPPSLDVLPVIVRCTNYVQPPNLSTNGNCRLRQPLNRPVVKRLAWRNRQARRESDSYPGGAPPNKGWCWRVRSPWWVFGRGFEGASVSWVTADRRRRPSFCPVHGRV